MKSRSDITLYHGTSMSSARKIIENGFHSGFLTQSYEQAEYYSEESFESDGSPSSEPAILAVKVPFSGLKVDFASIEEPLTMVREKHDLKTDSDFFEALDADEIGWPENESDWKRGLFLTDTVLFSPDDGSLGVAHIYNGCTVGLDDISLNYPELICPDKPQD